MLKVEILAIYQHFVEILDLLPAMKSNSGL